MYIEDLISELGQKMGLPDLRLEEDGTCRLIFDKKYVVDMEVSDDKKTLYVYSVVGEIPPENKEPLYETLLEANLFGMGTGRASLGIDPEKGEILLSANLLLENMDFQEFVNFLEDFVNRVETWQERLSAESGGSGETQGETILNENIIKA